MVKVNKITPAEDVKQKAAIQEGNGKIMNEDLITKPQNRSKSVAENSIGVKRNEATNNNSSYRITSNMINDLTSPP